MNLLTGRNRFLKLVVLISLILNLFLPNITLADIIKDQYHLAEKLSNNLTKHVEQQRYREKWLLCIDEFNKVCKLDPSGSWAAAGLYRAGLLYLELYKRSRLNTDIVEAIDIFKRITKRYPSSLYCSKSELLLGQISKHRIYKKGNENNAISIDEKFALANMASDKLIISHDLNRNRHSWIEVINLYYDIYELDPKGKLASEALFVVGKLYMDLYSSFFQLNDRTKSHEIFTKLQNLYPHDTFAKKAKKIISASETSVWYTEKHNMAFGENPLLQQATVKGIRVWSNPTYTRVVIDLDKETSFTHNLLKEQSCSIEKLQRLYLDLSKSKLGKNIETSVQINDELLRGARAAQHDNNTVRVVLDTKSLRSYKVFTLKNPCRVVLDISGVDKNLPDNNLSNMDFTFNEDILEDNIARQLSLGVSKIVIDPGHGGKDYGAPGILKGIYEKDITLQIANRLASNIRNNIGCEVVLTRETDCYLSLEERTAFANTENADLFISIHTNAAKNKGAHGIETFFLNLATDNEAIVVAARENETSKKNISDLETILSSLIQSAKISESNRLAVNLQNGLCSHATSKYNHIVNKGVKQAPFYVLLGAQMPAVLLETSFISNDRECKRLRDADYQKTLCDGIVIGIKEYIKCNKTFSGYKKNYHIASDE